MNPLTNHFGYQTPASLEEVDAIVDQIRGEDGLKARAAVMMALNWAHAQVEKSLETAGIATPVEVREAWISASLVAALVNDDFTGTSLAEDDAVEAWLASDKSGWVYMPSDPTVRWQTCEITGLQAECLKTPVAVKPETQPLPHRQSFLGMSQNDS